jgi:drug/metabolite transporter (DMT)-like permease
MTSIDDRTTDVAEREQLGRLTLPAALLVVLCCALWGGNSVAVKFTVAHIPPIGCAGIRFLLSVGLIAIWCRIEGTSLRLTREQIWPVVSNALLLFLQMAAFNWGTKYTDAGRASVFINVHPFVVAPLSWLLLSEPIGWRAVVGLVLAGGGVAMLFDQPGYTSGASLVGDLAVIVSGSLIGVMMIYQKGLLRRMKPNHLLFWHLFLAVPLFFSYSAVVEGFAGYKFNFESMSGLAYQSVLVSGFCFITWMSLLRRYPANQLAAFGFLTPFFGIGTARLLLGEPMALSLVIGCGLVGWGLYLITRPRPSEKGTATPHAIVPAAAGKDSNGINWRE